ncbi:hypothetical protein BJ165DRAFT_637262 [Panaeolus papilionaceus]|nr:hypothetical protein BJ165DRAFT_637262 [Panaeolus papilionaceus]
MFSCDYLFLFLLANSQGFRILLITIFPCGGGSRGVRFRHIPTFFSDNGPSSCTNPSGPWIHILMIIFLHPRNITVGFHDQLSSNFRKDYRLPSD